MSITITIPATEGFDEETMTFVDIVEARTLTLEHSLVSLAEWESKWKIPFLDTKEKTNEQTLDYIRCMCQEPITIEDIKNIPPEEIARIEDYIADPMSAAVFSAGGKPVNASRTRMTTAENIYINMLNCNIPFECQYWHLNRLLALIKGYSIVNNPKSKKMSKADVYNSNKARNMARRAKYNTRG